MPSSRWLSPVAAGIAIAAFCVVKILSVDYTLADDNLYLYLADRMADGLLPYRDFFHAHPPLHLVPGALLFAVTGGFSLGVGKAIPIVASALAGFFLYRGSRRMGELDGVLACVLFLFAFDPLRIASHYVGASLAAMWIALAFERLSARQAVHAGLAFALGALTLLNVAPAGIGVGLVYLLLDRSGAVRFGAAGLAFFAAAALLCVAIVGGAFFEQVVLYHFAKAPGDSTVLRSFNSVIRYNPWLVFGALCGMVALQFGLAGDEGRSLTGRGEKKASARSARETVNLRRLPLLALGGAMTSVAFFAWQDRVFNYYFEILFVCLAPLAAFGLAELLRKASAALRSRSPGRAVEALLLVAILGTGLARSSSVRISWNDYWWPAANRFDAAVTLADEVARRSVARDTILGDYLSTPLIALLSDRRIAFDEADLNGMRFETGMLDLDALIAKLEADPPRLILTRTDGGISNQTDFMAWVEYRYAPVHRHPAAEPRHVIWGNE